MIKRKNTKNKQAMIHITLHRKRKIEQHEPHYKYGNIPVLRKVKWIYISIIICSTVPAALTYEVYFSHGLWFLSGFN
jgi:hypothetical protein